MACSIMNMEVGRGGRTSRSVVAVQCYRVVEHNELIYLSNCKVP